MISVVALWNTLVQSAKIGTAGYQSASEFNQDLAAVQISAMGLLCPMYAKETSVQELLSPFVKSVDISTTKPTECFYFLGATINGVAAYPITPEQAALYESSPIRMPRATSNESEKTAFYYLTAGKITYLYSGTFTGTMRYIRTPAAATIVLTPVSTADRDYVTPTAGADLEWPESAFNLILAMMQEKLGIEMKEDILTTIGRTNTQIETAKA